MPSKLRHKRDGSVIVAEAGGRARAEQRAESVGAGEPVLTRRGGGVRPHRMLLHHSRVLALLHVQGGGIPPLLGGGGVARRAVRGRLNGCEAHPPVIGEQDRILADDVVGIQHPDAQLRRGPGQAVRQAQDETAVRLQPGRLQVRAPLVGDPDGRRLAVAFQDDPEPLRRVQRRADPARDRPVRDGVETALKGLVATWLGIILADLVS